MHSLVHLFRKFMVIGSTSFGGYMALIAMMREQFVTRDKVIDDEVITEGIAIASVLPGPVAVNVVAYTGYMLGGVRGALVSVVAVLIPSFVLVSIFAVLYFSFGELVNVNTMLKGVMPVIVALLFSVAANMGFKSVSRWPEALILLFATTVFIFVPRYEIVLGILLISASFGILSKRKIFSGYSHAQPIRITYLLAVAAMFVAAYFLMRYFASENMMARLFTEFASISLTLFGGGYVMVPILKSILVEQTQWFSLDEFVVGISVGQVTPGPILISAAFFGYKLNGIPGALLATVAIFFPSSMLMIIISKFFIQFRTNPIVQGALSGIKPAIVGLIIAAGVSIFRDYWELSESFISFFLLVISFVLFFRFKINPAIVVMVSGLAGYLVFSA
ncbi:MAG: chromate efflux transporter [Cyclobacteriaceae bacterium]